MLFEIAKSLNALTRSPAMSAINEARRQARRYLETGGIGRTRTGSNSDTRPTDYVRPLDVSADDVAKAIEAKLGASDQPTDPRPVIERRAGGRIVVPARPLLRLGDGRFDRGKQFMHAIVKQIRARRMLSKRLPQGYPKRPSAGR